MPAPHLEAMEKQRLRKEFVMEMQAKGKLPKVVTEASERHDAVYHETRKRIFPGKGGIETVLTNWVDQSLERIDKVSPALGAQEVETRKNQSIRHREMKERLKQLESAVASERQARLEVEESLNSIRSAAGSVRDS